MPRRTPPVPPEVETRIDASPHDGLFRYAFRRPEHAAAALRTWLPEPLLAHLDLAALRRIDPVSGDDRLGERRCDLLFEARLKGRPVLIQFVLEHQSTVDRDMPLRLLRTTAELWTDWRRRHPSGRLPPIVPCVLYHGARRWTAPRDLHGLLDLGDAPEVAAAMSPLVPQLRYLVDDLNRAPESALRARPWPALPKLAVLLLKCARPDADLSTVVPRWAELVRALAADPDRDAWSAIVRYILTATVTPPGELAERLAGHLPGEVQEEIMSTADKLIAEGMARGLARGREEGWVEGREEGREEGLALVRSILRKQLQLLNGGPLSTAVQSSIDSASAETLARWTERVLTAPTAEAVVSD